MNQSGTLRKRKKRTIAKVSGLSVIPYDEFEDQNKILTLPSLVSKQRLIDIDEETEDVIIKTHSVFEIDTNIDEAEGEDYPRRSQSSKSENINSTNADILNSMRYWEVKEKGSQLLVSEKALRRLRQMIFWGSRTGIFPFEWNSKTMSMKPFQRNNIWWRYFWYIFFLQSCCLLVFNIVAFVEGISAEDSNYRTIFMNSFIVFWYTYNIYFNVNMYIYGDEIREYINALLRMNVKLVKKFVISTKDWSEPGKLVYDVAIPFNFCQNFICVLFFWAFPTQRWYLYSYVFDPKIHSHYWLIPGALHEFVMVAQVITNFTLMCWLPTAHSNSVSFWLLELHNHNISDYTKDTIRVRRTALSIYRCLQVLCGKFNSCVAPIGMPTMKITSMLACVPCAYVLIRSMNQTFLDEFPAILTYPAGFIICGSGAFAVLTLSAEMNDLASSFVDSWCRTQNIEIRRFLKSCPALHVRVAGFYEITVSTTITFFHVMVDYIIDCIITF